MILKGKLIFAAILLTVFTMVVKAQQTPLYTQYMLNGFLINPAMAGSEGYTSVAVTAREQYVGFPGSPRTQSVGVQTRLLPNSWVFNMFKKTGVKKRYKRNSNQSKVGLGMYVLNDRNGIVDKTGFEMAYAYHLFMKQSQLSFGLGLSYFNMRVDQSYLKGVNGESVNSSTSPSSVQPDFSAYNQLNLNIPDANFGVYYSSPNLYGGLAVSNLFQAYLKFSGFDSRFKQSRNYIITGGYKLELDKDYMLEPSTLLKYSQAGAFQFDLGARLYVKEDYWAGISYRSGADKGAFGFSSSALSFLGGVRVERFFFGYSYDYNFNEIGPLTFGSHEFMLAYKFGDNTRRYRWLNRY